jgi:K+-transporting ATPase c subunit
METFQQWFNGRNEPEHNKFKTKRYQLQITLCDSMGAIQAVWTMERRGDSTATCLSHQLWAASQSGLRPHIVIDEIVDVQSVAQERNTSGQLPIVP